MAVSLVLVATLMVVSGCGRRGSPVPVKAETNEQAERRSSAEVVEERARLGLARPAPDPVTDPVDAAKTPLPSDAPEQVLQTRRRGSFFLDFLL
jgi:hypothetical protein